MPNDDFRRKIALSACSVLSLVGCGLIPGHIPGERAAPSVAVTSIAHARPMTTPRLTPNLIKSAQGQLQHDGFYSGPIDGIVGRQTGKALLAFQQQKGLPETGRLDGPALAKMNLPQNL